jgi:2',3'-cyclic-nucleotide 3'-phosphodiesterase
MVSIQWEKLVAAFFCRLLCFRILVAITCISVYPIIVLLPSVLRKFIQSHRRIRTWIVLSSFSTPFINEMGIAIWIMPSADDRAELTKIMKLPIPSKLSGLTNTGSYPPFEPHITLASFPSTTPLSSIAAAVPSTSSPLIRDLNCRFASLEVGPVFFRSVYVAIKPTLSLQDLNRHVHEKMGVEPKTPSFPHLSLCYINDQDAVEREREKYAQRLRGMNEVVKEGNKETGGKLELKLADGWTDGFVAKEIWIVRCEGPIEGWEPLQKIHLN